MKNRNKNGTSTRTNGFVSNSLKFISSCIKTVSSNVKSAGASVAGSISGDSCEDLHEDQIYCLDAFTLENKFNVLTYPVPQLGGQGINGVNIGYGPMAVGPRWLAYASNNSLMSNTGRLSPQSLSPSPGVSPSTSPGSANLVARYAMESSKQLTAGLINLGDMGYKTLSKGLFSTAYEKVQVHPCHQMLTGKVEGLQHIHLRQTLLGWLS